MLDTPCVTHPSLQGLDPASRRNLWDVIKRQRAGRGIILTTHNMEEAEVHSNFDCMTFGGVLRTFLLCSQSTACSMRLGCDALSPGASNANQAKPPAVRSCKCVRPLTPAPWIQVLCDRLGIFVDGQLVCVGAPKEITARYGGYLVSAGWLPLQHSEERMHWCHSVMMGAPRKVTARYGGYLVTAGWLPLRYSDEVLYALMSRCGDVRAQCLSSCSRSGGRAAQGPLGANKAVRRCNRSDQKPNITDSVRISPQGFHAAGVHHHHAAGAAGGRGSGPAGAAAVAGGAEDLRAGRHPEVRAADVRGVP
jgi:hypothetical protein